MKCIKVECNKEAAPDSNYCQEHLDGIQLKNIESDTIAYLGLPEDFSSEELGKVKIDLDKLLSDD